LYARRALGLKPAPEFEAWLQKMQIFSADAPFRLNENLPPAFRNALLRMS
jgi:ethanolamine ammonia-lyase large subunit